MWDEPLAVAGANEEVPQRVGRDRPVRVPLAVFAHNLFDQNYIQAGNSGLVLAPSDPATYGLTLRLRL